MGYGRNLLPIDDAEFEYLLKLIKAAKYNTIHGTYTPARLALCDKHGVKLMVDLLAADEHHVYKSPDRARAVCEKLRDSKSVWGYNVWNDPIGKTAAGRRRDVDSVHEWDPTHPVYCGTYRTEGMSTLTNPDVLGYYDFHWQRRPDGHFQNLMRYGNWAKERDAVTYRWFEVDAGKPGEENVGRCRYSVNTSLACGLKGCMWFLGSKLLDAKGMEWTALGRDIAKVNEQIAPLGRELIGWGRPAHVYSTQVTCTADGQALPLGVKSRMPPGLEACAFPDGFALRPLAGEFVLGVFDSGDRRAFFLASHNARAAQTVKLRLAADQRMTRFDPATTKWKQVEVKDETIEFRLMPGGGELLRLER